MAGNIFYEFLHLKNYDLFAFEFSKAFNFHTKGSFIGQYCMNPSQSEERDDAEVTIDKPIRLSNGSVKTSNGHVRTSVVSNKSLMESTSNHI